MENRSLWIQRGALSLACVSLLACPAAAAWPTDPFVNVPLCTAANNQFYPRIVADGAGGAIVTWQDIRSGLDFDIYAMRVLASGVVDPAWPADGRALCSAANLQIEPEIVEDGAGGAIVTWSDTRSVITGADVYAQRVLASGAIGPTWPTDGRALCTELGVQEKPCIVSDGAGGAIVAWQDYRSGSHYDIYAQHVLANGTIDPAWPVDGRALCTAAGSQFEPQIVSDGLNGAIVTWQDSRGSDDDIYAQHVLAGGGVDPVWPTDGRALCTAADVQGFPGLVSDGANGAIVAWGDLRSVATTSVDVYAQRVLANGTLHAMWPVNGRALCTAANAQQAQVLVSDGASGAIVAWEDNRVDDFGIFAQRVRSDGTVDPVWDANGNALCVFVNDQRTPSIVTDDAGGAIVSWYDFREVGFNSDIYAQRVNSAGVTQWIAGGSAICKAPFNQYDPVVAVSGSGSAIVAWHDFRGASIDIYAQRVAANGGLGDGTVSVSGPAAASFGLEAVGPNPARGGTLTLHFVLSTLGDASLELFDVAGRFVASREVGGLGVGRHVVTLGDMRLAPGIYVVRLSQGANVGTIRAAVLE